ncbi:MAG TPA: hypothetical protein PKC28_14200 [Bdellovibrionales bacterium]|nr:hypothetical protein [Bdellovibrionales bacterium]
MIREIIFAIGFSAAAAPIAGASESIKTTYKVSGYAVEVMTVVQDAGSDRQKLVRDFFFPVLAKKISILPMISSVQFEEAANADVTTLDSSAGQIHRRRYPATATLMLPALSREPLMIEESFTACKADSECRPRAEVRIESLRDGRQITYDVDWEPGKTNSLRVVGRFAGDSGKVERNELMLGMTDILKFGNQRVLAAP